LRKLTAKAKKHRDAELERLRGDPQAAAQLEVHDQKIAVPASPGPFPAGSNVAELFRERWRQLVGLPAGYVLDARAHEQSVPGITSSSAPPNYTTPRGAVSVSVYDPGHLASNATFDPAYLGVTAPQTQTTPEVPGSSFPDLQSAATMSALGDFAAGQAAGLSYSTIPAASAPWSLGPGFAHWLWADADPSVDVFANVDVDADDVNMDLDGGEVDWYNWVESAKGIEFDTGQGDNGQA